MDRPSHAHGRYTGLHVGWTHRTRSEAAALATSCAEVLRKDPRGSCQIANQDDSDAAFIEQEMFFGVSSDDLAELAARLDEREVGVHATKSGYDVAVRLPLDPLESSDVLRRPESADPTWSYVVRIGWDGGNLDPRSKRTKQEAETLARGLVDRMRAKTGDVAKLVRDTTEDVALVNGDRPIEDRERDDQYKALAVRLEMNEVGILKFQHDYFIVKRVPEPAADPLETTSEVLSRAPATRVAAVEIIIPWSDAHMWSEPKPGATRSRSELDRLVKQARKRLENGASSFEEVGEGLGLEVVRFDVKPGDHYSRLRSFALRLNVGEIAVVRTPAGMKIVKRVE